MQQGIKFNRNGDALTHLMYADDLLIFAKGNIDEAHAIDGLLARYGQASGGLLDTWNTVVATSS
ncbi:hypothetical protein FRX31_004213, partial [Thalictrum thalictroides]